MTPDAVRERRPSVVGESLGALRTICRDENEWRRYEMKKLSSIAAVLILSGAIAATAAASLRTYTVGSKKVNGVGNVGGFSATVKNPYKIILYCEGSKALCGAKVVCVRGTKTFTWNRSNLGPGTWNLKRPTWYRLDSCQLKTWVKVGFQTGARVTVQATVRS
jgi:hypothetical protein